MSFHFWKVICFPSQASHVHGDTRGGLELAMIDLRPRTGDLGAHSEDAPDRDANLYDDVPGRGDGAATRREQCARPASAAHGIVHAVGPPADRAASRAPFILTGDVPK